MFPNRHFGHFWSQGHDHQSICRLRRRCVAVVFPKIKIGPLVGSRTWGGLVGYGDYPALTTGP